MSSPHDDIYSMEEDLDPNDDSPFVQVKTKEKHHENQLSVQIVINKKDTFDEKYDAKVTE